MKNIVIDNISTSYYITEDGKCYNDKTGKYLKGQIGKNGYLSYNITLPGGKKKRIYAHRAVALAYIKNQENKEQINHIDGDKLNNHVDNLEWVTASENQQHAIENELRKFKHVYCFDKDKNLIAEYKDIKDAARAVHASRGVILQELNKDVKTLCHSCYWSYEKEIGETKNYKNLGKAKVVYQYDLNGKYINRYDSIGQAARSLGLKNGSHIGECCRGKLKQYKGFVWRFADDIVLTSIER